ncbi:MAG: hypothetical protein IPH53_08200 [Flavobacteriales bacterium]|nr:hypothetical protein [Flavobacteriales bacterium]
MERSAAVSELGSMRNLKYFVRPFVVLLCMLHGRHIHAQHDMRYLVGDRHFNIWSTPDISAPPALTGTLHLESGLDSALALVGRVVLNDGPSTQGGNFTRESIARRVHQVVHPDHRNEHRQPLRLHVHRMAWGQAQMDR